MAGTYLAGHAQSVADTPAPALDSVSAIISSSDGLVDDPYASLGRSIVQLVIDSGLLAPTITTKSVAKLAGLPTTDLAVSERLIKAFLNPEKGRDHVLESVRAGKVKATELDVKVVEAWLLEKGWLP